MKIVTWNCNGAFRKKFEYLNQFEADIFVIQECENPAYCKDAAYKKWTQNHLWIGNSNHKGLGIFAKEAIALTKLDWTNIYNDHNVKHFLPCAVNSEFCLLAVWTHYNNSPNFGYMGQFWKYLQLHKNKMQNIFIAGDFNSNSKWDEWDRWWNHSDVVRELSEIGIESLYHTYTKEQQGRETKPTFYLQKNTDKPYHIDYCFASANFVESLNSVEVEPFAKWEYHSDHSPMIVTLKK